MADVELSVRTQLSRIVKELQDIAEASEQVGKHIGAGTDKVGEGVNEQTEKTGRYLKNLGSLGARVANQLGKDFKALASINAVSGALKFSEMFRGTIKETVVLSDTIRKVGPILGILQGRFAQFQASVTQGLGKIGVSSEAAGRALEGLSTTPVRGEENLKSYIETASKLASITREQGKEGDVAGGLSRVITARGGNPNDPRQMQAVANDVLRIQRATGKAATEVLGALEGLSSKTNPQFRSRVQGGGAVSLATASLIGGKDATTFLENYLSSNKYARFGKDAQGLGGIISQSGGLNLKAMENVIATAKGRGMGDAQAGLTTFGMSDEEAQGFMRLTEAMRKNGEVIDQARSRVVDINQAYRESMGLGEAFRASLNRVKGIAAGPLSYASQKGTDFLEKASGSNTGAAGVVGGAGVIAALLGGFGLRGVGGALAKGAAFEGATGRQVQPVYVVNANEIGGGSGVGGGLAAGGVGGGLAGIAKSALGVAGSAGLGYIIGKAAAESDANKKVLGYTRGRTSEGYEGDALERLIFKIDKLFGGGISGVSGAANEARVRVSIEEKTPNFRATTEPSRGASVGPRR